MSSLNQDFYLVREIGSDSFESGTGAYAVPKLYQKGPANGLVSKRNKTALYLEERHGTKRARYEAVPVTIILKVPS